MTVLLNKGYAGFPAGTTATFRASTESALVTQGLASVATTATTTTGAQTSINMTGIAAIAAGSSSVVITNPLVDATSTVFAVVAQAAADTTLLRVERVLTAAGSFTIYGTANATATTLVSWAVINNLPTYVTN